MATAVLSAAFVFFLAARIGRAGERVSPGVVDEMRRIEFAQINYDDEATPYYGYIKGSIPVLISAPHGAKHYRAAEGAWRKEDAYTASLAIVLGRLTGAHVLYVKNKTTEDPNNDTGTQYKEFLKKIDKGEPYQVRPRPPRGGARPVEGRYRDNERCGGPLFLPHVQKRH